VPLFPLQRLACFEKPKSTGAVSARSGAALAAARPGPARGAPTAAGVAARLSALLGPGNLGASTGAMVTNLSTGQVLYQLNPATGFAPAYTTKIATAIAALDTLGPGARFTTRVVLPAGRPAGSAVPAGRPARIVLVGGGDPTLAAGRFPAADYPQPATLSALAAATAKALGQRQVRTVRLSFDATRFGGPLVASGWKPFGAPGNYVSSGNVTPITGLEVDQGRLTASGSPEDADDPANYRPRSVRPSADAAHAFARFLSKDGITVRGTPRAIKHPPPRSAGPATELAAVQSPPLAAIVQQMLTESNNVIAETLARQVAVATGRPGTFDGAAAAVMAVDARLKVAGLHLHDGSGLSPLDRISPRALVALITLAARTGPGRLRGAVTGLPVAGFSGTLGPGSFFGPFGHVALGAVRAKTGNLTHVATLAGLADTSGGQILAFAFMGNDIPSRLGTQPELTLAELATTLAGCGCR
ncbi:MAG: D-alanyl-D-alanine carboxypeptidase/D-alanyl-D-alanine endopeptidase, partial [Streptosporangiaceae bacterium]